MSTTSPVSVLTVKANNVTPEPAAGPSAPEVATVEVPADGTSTAARVTAREQKVASGRPDLTEERFIQTTEKSNSFEAQHLRFVDLTL